MSSALRDVLIRLRQRFIMKQIKGILLIACLLLFSYQLRAQTKQKVVEENEKISQLWFDKAVSVTMGMTIPRDGSTGYIDLNKHVKDGEHKPMSALTVTKALNLNKHNVNPQLLTVHPMVTWEDTNSVEEEQLSIAVSNESNEQIITISAKGLDSKSINLEITEISGLKVYFDPKKAVFNSQTNELQLKLTISKGIYTFKIPTSSGTITQTQTLFW